MIPRVALTSGEPAGIGPELCLALARDPLPCELVCLADRALLSERARQLTLPVTLRSYTVGAAAAAPGRHSCGAYLASGALAMIRRVKHIDRAATAWSSGVER